MTWKKAEFAKGTVLRLLETGGLTNSVRLRFPWHEIRSAYRCNAVEDQGEAIAYDGSTVAIEVRPHQIVTLRVELEAVAGPDAVGKE
jgi:alpha-mannosidase